VRSIRCRSFTSVKQLDVVIGHRNFAVKWGGNLKKTWGEEDGPGKTPETGK